jgi:dienelactone hydrolase
MTLQKWPHPTGCHPVGVVDFDLRDPSRAMMYARPPAIGRTITVTCWYPAATTDGFEQRSYLKPEEVSPGTHRVFELQKVPDAEQQRIAALLTASHVGAPAAAGRFPLLVFNHGAGSYREQNSFLMEHLASKGYVVASVAHPHESGSYISANGDLVRLSEQVKTETELARSLIGKHVAGFIAPTLGERIQATRALMKPLRDYWLGKLAHVWAEDLVLVADRILDGEIPSIADSVLEEVGYFGMSYGAHPAALAAMLDVRAKAFANVDGGLFTAEPLGRELGMPVLCVTHDISAFAAAVGMQPIEPPRADGMNTVQAFYVTADGSQPKSPLHRITVRQAGHFDFLDAPLLVPPIPGSVMFPSGERMIKIQCDVIGAFFDQYVNNRQGILAETLSSDLANDLVVHQP